jgi:taurine--2-oxoglutarate transaminase
VPGGERETVLHSWCVQAEWRAPTVVGGAGARFRDEHGREYLDMSSLSECCNLGHQHPHVVAAIKRQADALCFTTSAWGAEPRAALAAKLLE